MASAQMDLGRVKGDPLTWADLTEEQKESLRGEKGDNAPPPIIKVGNVTTIEPSGSANVIPHTDGNTTTFDFQIPRGQKGDDYLTGMLNTMEEVSTSTDETKFPGILAIQEMLEDVTEAEINAILNN